MRLVLLVVTTSVWFAVSAESCIAGIGYDCEDGLLPTWEERVEWCVREGRPVTFLSERSQLREDVFKDVMFDSRFLPSELQENPQRVGDELCPVRSQLTSVLQIYCEGSLQYETARGSIQTCVVKIRRENRTNKHCYHQVQTRATWKCESNATFSCVPCRNSTAINITTSISFKWSQLRPQAPPVQGSSLLHVEVTDGDMLMNKSVFCYTINRQKPSKQSSIAVLHFKNSTYLLKLDSYFHTDTIIWCEGIEILTGQVVRSRICLGYNYTCTKWLDDRNIMLNKSLEILVNKSPKMTNATAVQNAMDLILRSAHSMHSGSVAQALKGFETFASETPLDDRRELRLNKSSLFSTLIFASTTGIIASASNMTSIPRGSDAVAIAGDADVTVAVVLSPEDGNRRVSLTKFTGRAIQLFKQTGYTVNSHVVSITVESKGIHYMDIVLRRWRKEKYGKCAIWNLEENRWDTSYCERLVIGEVADVCRCFHQSHYAEIIVDDDVEWGESRALDAISMLGCSLSLLGVSGIVATAALSDEWRRRPSTKVLLQLVSSVALRDAMFVAVSVNHFPDAWCHVAGVVLHYAVLAASFWSVAAAVLQTLRLGTVAGVASVPHVVLVCASCAWLLPLFPVGLVLAVKGPTGGYAKRGDATGLCFPRKEWFYTTVAVPTGFAVLVNLCFFCYLTYVIFQCSSEGRRIRKSSSGSTLVRRKLLTCALLFFLFGLTWVFGFPARSFVVACIFCAVATPQGFVLFLFFVFGDAQARNKWSSALSANFISSRASKKSVNNRTFFKWSSTRTAVHKGDQAKFKSYVTTEGDAEERTYRFLCKPPHGGESEIAQSSDHDLPDGREVDCGAVMYSFPPNQEPNRPTVMLESYVIVKEVNDGSRKDKAKENSGKEN